MLRDIIDRVTQRKEYVGKLEQRCEELTLEVATLRRELAGVDAQGDVLDPTGGLELEIRKLAMARVVNLKSAIAKLLLVMESQWCGADEQATLRTARAIMENELDGIG